MRLLKIESPGEFSLTDDTIGDHIHPYATLSHTWEPDTGEVTFKDLEDSTGKSRDGYKKIQFCGDRAAGNGLR